MQSQHPTSSLALQPVADHAGLSQALYGLTGSLFRAAEENIETAIDGGEYTALERRAMIAIEALRLTNGMDLAAVLTRGQIISQIETEGLVGVHPNQYTDLSHMAREQGISVSELSDTKALCEVIFPYIVEELAMSLAETWTNIGKSGFREMVPALRSLITGENASHNSVRQAVEHMLNQAAADMVANNEVDPADLETEEARTTVRRRAVSTLLEAGATLPARELRRTIRPSRTPNIPAATLQVGDAQWFAVLKIDRQDQYDMLVRLLGTHADNMLLDGSGMSQANRRFLGSFFGE